MIAGELFNTALENLIDALHPEINPLVGAAKDCAAASVLIFSLASLGIFALLVFHVFFHT